MSTLLVDVLEPGKNIEQVIKISRNVNVAAIRPYIYKQGVLLSGTLQLDVLKGVTVLATKTISYTDLNANIDAPYSHGYVKFEFESLPLQVDPDNDTEEYILRLSMSGYTPTTTVFVGACKDWDDSKYPTYGTGDSSFEQPYGFEIFEYRS
jgi:hypothetical protein